MEEIRFHGRGGQGAVIGSEVLAHAFFLEEKFVQAFPAFGVERRGAPVTAFCRCDERPINLRNQIYEPDHIVVLDGMLLETGEVTKGLQPGGSIVVNGKRDAAHYRKSVGDKFALFIVDAAAIGLEFHLGSPQNPIVNTAILGAFAWATNLVKLKSVEDAIMDYVAVKKDANVKAAKAAWERTVRG